MTSFKVGDIVIITSPEAINRVSTYTIWREVLQHTLWQVTWAEPEAAICVIQSLAFAFTISARNYEIKYYAYPDVSQHISPLFKKGFINSPRLIHDSMD